KPCLGVASCGKLRTIRGDLMQPEAEIRHDWTQDEVLALFELPFNDLIWRAQGVHRQYFDANTVQVSTLLSIKTGACPEDCAYCPQSVRYDTGVARERLLDTETVVAAARAAKAAGATRFCASAWARLGAAPRARTWRRSRR